ncbi:FadR/GntR family transcriptional regulator [Microbacterium sulfonylureivorans]|uniref:FadR/GntR family transcriptional regulator n=1 Tax=Microbacterium sulfonylureivorans TaxID=2486854 RepID=UPI000FDC2CF6|nr:FCD domain-containing protein [Microbacterium sulfonylureivorans]
MPEPLDHFVARLLALATIEEDTGARRLPPERELGDALGMSRGALREQLAVLERLGFLHRTQGRGTYLDTPSYGFVRTYFTIARSLGYITEPDVAEARVLVEQAVAEAAARRATDEQIAGLREAIDRMEAADAAGDLDSVHVADADFHRRLLHVVANPVLLFLQEGLRRALDDDMRSRRASVTLAHASGEFDRTHADIVDALVEHDPEAARLAMRRHFGITEADAVGAAAVHPARA